MRKLTRNPTLLEATQLEVGIQSVWLPLEESDLMQWQTRHPFLHSFSPPHLAKWKARKFQFHLSDLMSLEWIRLISKLNERQILKSIYMRYKMSPSSESRHYIIMKPERPRALELIKLQKSESRQKNPFFTKKSFSMFVEKLFMPTGDLVWISGANKLVLQSLEISHSGTSPWRSDHPTSEQSRATLPVYTPH